LSSAAPVEFYFVDKPLSDKHHRPILNRYLPKSVKMEDRDYDNESHVRQLRQGLNPLVQSEPNLSIHPGHGWRGKTGNAASSKKKLKLNKQIYKKTPILHVMEAVEEGSEETLRRELPVGDLADQEVGPYHKEVYQEQCMSLPDLHTAYGRVEVEDADNISLAGYSVQDNQPQYIHQEAHQIDEGIDCPDKDDDNEDADEDADDSNSMHANTGHISENEVIQNNNRHVVESKVEQNADDIANDSNGRTCWVKRWEINRVVGGVDMQNRGIQEEADARPDVPISTSQQNNLESLVSPSLMDKIRTIHLKRRNNEGLGFAVRGGFEHGVGVVVSHVVPNSPAFKQGLQVGDELLRINGFIMNEALHDEALKLIKAKRHLILKVRNIGMIPVRNSLHDDLEWKPVGVFNYQQNSIIQSDPVEESAVKGREIHLVVNIADGNLGCSICCGPADRPGIYIQSVQPGSLAQEAGLQVGDQVVEVNKDVFHARTTHAQAMVSLKSNRNLKMRIIKQVGADLFFPELPSPILEEEPSPYIEFSVDKDDYETAEQLTDELLDIETDGTHGLPAEVDSNSDLLESALRAMEDEPRPRKSAMKQSKQRLTVPPEDIGQPLKDFSENEAQKRQIIQEKSSPSPQKSPVHAAVRFYEPMKRSPSGGLSPGYMHSQKPTFRMQKPVLLNVVDHKENATNTLEKEGREMNEDNFSPYRVFTNEQIAGRQIRLVNITKSGDLGITVECRKAGTPESRIIINDVANGSAAHNQGGIQAGDQIMLVDWTSLIGVSLEYAMDHLHSAYTSQKSLVQLVIAKAPPEIRGLPEREFVAYI